MRTNFRHPAPFQTDAVRALADEKLHTMQLMVEQEQRNVDSLRQDLLSSMGLDLTSSGKKKKQASEMRDLEISSLCFLQISSSGQIPIGLCNLATR